MDSEFQFGGVARGLPRRPAKGRGKLKEGPRVPESRKSMWERP